MTIKPTMPDSATPLVGPDGRISQAWYLTINRILQNLQYLNGAVTTTGTTPPGGTATQLVVPQAVASSSWVINHNLNLYPQVTVLDSAHNLIEGSVSYPTTNQIVISFNSTVAGTAILTY